MASASVTAAVLARLRTTPGWINLASCPFVDENEVGNSPQKTFLTIEYPVANEDRINVGKPGLFRESGGIRFIIHILNLSGLDQARQWTDELRDLFRDQDFAGVTTYAAAPAAFDPSNRRGTFYVVPFVVPYHFDLIR